MKKLIKGLHKFKTEVFSVNKNFFEDLVAEGQSPEVLFITCSDSRIDPSLGTSTEPGDLFIMRNAGNVVPTYAIGSGEAATIEFAVNALGVQDIILCGHSHCGAVGAALDESKLADMPSLSSWVQENITPTLELVRENYNEVDESILTQENVLAQVENLKTHPAVMEKLASGQLNIHAWVYKIETGDILSYNDESEQFESVHHQD